MFALSNDMNGNFAGDDSNGIPDDQNPIFLTSKARLYKEPPPLEPQGQITFWATNALERFREVAGRIFHDPPMQHIETIDL